MKSMSKSFSFQVDAVNLPYRSLFKTLKLIANFVDFWAESWKEFVGFSR